MPFDQRAYDAQPNQSVGPERSAGTNRAIAEQYPTDANMQGMQSMGQSGQKMTEVMNRFMEHFGPEMGVSVLDALITEAVKLDQGGSPSEYAPMPKGPDFGRGQPVTTIPPTDGNLQGLEAELGYPPSTQRRFGAPLRNSGNPRAMNALSGR